MKAEAPAAPAPPPVEEPDFRLSPDGASDKGALTLDVEAVNEIEDGDDRHVYTFTATAGQDGEAAAGDGRRRLERQRLLRALRHDATRPDGSLALGLDSRQRSRREQITFYATGEYTIVVGAYEGVGVEGYTIVIEG